MNLPVELIRQIAGNLWAKWDLAAMCLTCKDNNTIVGEILWRAVTVFEGDIKDFFEFLDNSAERAGWIRELDFKTNLWSNHDERSYVPETAPNSKLCALFAKVLRKMPGLLSLTLPRVLCGPAVIAELCAHKESNLRSLHMNVGRVDDTEDVSILPDLELSTGMLETLRIVGCDQEEYPQRFVDGISRIIRASSGTIYTLDICGTLHVQQFFKDVKGFPELRYLDIIDVDLIPLRCFISETKRIRDLSVYCKGNAIDPYTANCIALYFGSIDRLYLTLGTHPWDVAGLMELGPSLIALCTEIKVLTIEVYGYAEMHGVEYADDGEQDEEQAESDVEGGEEAVGDSPEVGEYTGEEIVAEEVVGHSEDEADEGVGGDWDAGNAIDVANEEGEDHLPPTQVEVEHSIVQHWSSYGKLKQGIFWYKEWSREWSRDDTSGEWSLNERLP